MELPGQDLVSLLKAGSEVRMPEWIGCTKQTLEIKEA